MAQLGEFKEIKKERKEERDGRKKREQAPALQKLRRPTLWSKSEAEDQDFRMQADWKAFATLCRTETIQVMTKVRNARKARPARFEWK